MSRKVDVCDVSDFRLFGLGHHYVYYCNYSDAYVVISVTQTISGLQSIQLANIALTHIGN